MKFLMQEDLLSFEQGKQLEASESLDDQDLPDTIADVLEKRCVALSESEQTLLQWFSVLKRPVTVRELEIVTECGVDAMSQISQLRSSSTGRMAELGSTASVSSTTDSEAVEIWTRQTRSL